MLTQREQDIASVEIELELAQLVDEWLKDYLGNRYGNRQGQFREDNTEGSEANEPASAVPEANQQGVPY